MEETPKESKESEEPEDNESSEGTLQRPTPRTIWITEGAWEKMSIIKKDVRGTWSRVMEIFCEQMMASGLVSAEAREEIAAIGKKHGTELVDDSGWRSSFGIGEPWAFTVAASQKKIAEEAAKMTEAVMDLGEIIEDHAIAMLELEENRSNYEEGEEA